MPKDQALWNAIFMGLFLLFFMLSFWTLTDGLDTYEWFYGISAFDIVLISLATYRLVRLASVDKIFTFVRNMFLVKQVDGTYIKQGGGPRRTVAELLECIWCTGLWASLFTTTLYFSFDVGYFLVLVLAVAAVGSFLQNFSQMIARIGQN